MIVRTVFAQTPKGSTEEGRPDTVVQVWARSGQCVARGVRSKFSFSAGVDKMISRVFYARRCFAPAYLLLFEMLAFFAHTYLLGNCTA